MKSRLLTACVVIGSMLAPLAAYSAEDADHDRAHPKQWVKDSAITTQIKTKMATDREVSATHIKVDTDDHGVVQLSGTAKSRAEADKAVAIAQSVKGVTSVDNKIKISQDR
jgi:hyperosmotically inducible periplasmic protein